MLLAVWVVLFVQPSEDLHAEGMHTVNFKLGPTTLSQNINPKRS